MSLQNISNDELIVRIQKLVRTERKVMHLVLLHIAEIDSRKLYAKMGFDGMYSYLTKGLGYSESAAYRRLQSARLLRKVPSVAEKVESGALNLSQLTQVQKCLKESSKNGEVVSVEKTLEILNKLDNQNSFETQKTLALEMDLPVEFHERIKPQKDDSVRLELTLTQKQFAELEQAKSLLSHICPEGQWSEVIATLAEQFNKKKLQGQTKLTQSVAATEIRQEFTDSSIGTAGREKPYMSENPKPVGNKKSTSSRSSTSSSVVTFKSASAKVSLKYKRRYISVHTKRDLLKKAQHRCEYQDPATGLKCSSHYQLEVDHLFPVALGGTNDIENLRILCRTHNFLAARNAGLI